MKRCGNYKMKIIDIDHLVLTTADVEACLHFYTDTLGMEKRETNGRFSLWFGRHKILPAADKPLPGSLDFCFEIEDDIEEIYGELKRKKAPLVTGIVERNGAKGKMRSVYLRDPDGNLVELASYR